MLRARSALLLVLVSAVMGSCAVPTANEEAPVAEATPSEAPAAAAAAPDTTGASDATELEPADDAPRRDPVVPTGTFATLEALCREQKKLVLPRVRAAEKERLEGSETTLTPRCEVSAKSLAGVAVELRAPFLEVRAIVVETGHATETHLVIRTDAGWSAIGAASVRQYHDDPGCFSIERDSGIVSIRVAGTERPALVVIEGSDRGAAMEEGEPDEGGNLHPVMWDDVMQRARACQVDATGQIACDAPRRVRTERIPSTTEGGRHAELRFSAEVGVDAAGHLRAAAVDAR